MISFDSLAASLLDAEERSAAWREHDPDPPDEREDDEQAVAEAEERDDLTADGRRGYDGRWDEDDNDETAEHGGGSD